MDNIYRCIFMLLMVVAMHFSQPLFAAEIEDGAVIYIKPSPSSPCPVEPCDTLSQFAANLSQIQLNVTLLLLSGNHSLNLTVSIAGIKYFSVLSQSPSSPNIHCGHDTNIAFNNVSNVIIQGISFEGCGGNMISLVDHLTVRNCSFIGNEKSGTALNIIQSNAILVNCSFVSNRVGMYHGPLMILENQQDPSDAKFIAYAYVGGAVIANQSNVSLIGSKIEKNYAGIGGAIYSTLGSRVSVINCTFTENNVCFLRYQNKIPVCFGGAFFCEHENSQVEIIHNEFRNNSGLNGGVFTIFDQCTINITSSSFSGNTAMSYPGYGGVLYLIDSATAFIDESSFFNNSASSAGGAVSVDSSVVIIRNSEFTNNSVRQFGGVIVMFNGNLTIERSYFRNNYAFTGGVLNALLRCLIRIHDSEFSNNEAQSHIDPGDAAGGAVTIAQSCTLSTIRTLFRGNLATYGGAISLTSRSELYTVNSSFIANRAMVGGAIGAEQSEVNFFGSSIMTENVVENNGGVIYATSNSFLNVSGELNITLNKANDSGGGIYLFKSKLYCQFYSILKLFGNKAIGKGGGIFAINAIVNVFSDRDSSVESALIFSGNTAAMGGGIYLELTSELHVIKLGNDYTKTIYNLRFIDNSANYGGAIYNADETNYKVCASKSYYSRKDSIGTECFLQILTPMQTIDMKYNIVTTEFAHNSARMSGSILYGGLLDRCTLMSGTEILLTNNRTPLDGVTFFLNTSTLNNTDGISSSPVQVCLCESGNGGTVPNCSLQQLKFSVMKGEKFQVSLVAVDQVNRTLPNITVYSSLKYAESGLGEGQMAQVTSTECTVVSFSVLSPHSHEEITLYAESPCRNATKSQRNVLISFLNCTCPIGFQPDIYEHNNCVCDCDPKLRQYVTNCSSQTDSLVREGNFWITYLNNTKSNIPNDYNYLTYPHCPLDYCLPPEIKVQINLAMANGADAQCAHNRSGTLCGVCRSGHTLSLGSSRCIPCSANEWSQLLAVLLLVASLAGIGLVAIMLILKLTVDKGTLNGLIFYANIIGANSSTFFPSSSKKLNGLYTFISWLNLDIGFDVCFFKGMDTYWKTWIQLAFPAYVILLVVTVMYLSDHSLTFTKLISRKKRNPVATLATLILLSHAKFLRTVITTLSFVTLVYPEDQKMMWLPDATIAYLQGRHIVLFIVAILILVIGIAYTFLLFAWQWLVLIKRIIWPQKLDQFVKVYHAPYRNEHRYWTGLLLLARVVLYLVFVFSNPSLNLLMTTAVTCGLLFLKGHFGKIYDEEKSRIVDTIEMINYLNIALFSAATLFTSQTREYQTKVAFTSVSVTFALFLFVLAYHIYTELLSTCWAALKLKLNKMFNRGIDSYSSSDITRPTFSTVEGLPERNALPSVLDNADKFENQQPASCSMDKNIVEMDNDDILSIDTTPLLQD